MKTPSDYLDKYFAISCYFIGIYLLLGSKGLGAALLFFAICYAISRFIDHS